MDVALGLLTLLIGLFVTLVVGQRNRRIANILLLAFGLRAGLTLIDSFLFQLPGAGDGIGWDYGAARMAQR